MRHFTRLAALLVTLAFCAAGSTFTLTYSGVGTGSSSIFVPAYGGTWVGDNYRISDISVTLSNLSLPHAGSVEIVIAQLEVEGLFNTALDSAVLFDGTVNIFNNHKFVASNTYTFADGSDTLSNSWTFWPQTYPSGEYSPTDPLSEFYNNTTRGFWSIGIWSTLPVNAGWNWTININAVQVQDVPEPTSMALAGIGLAVLGAAGYRSRRRRETAV